MTMTHVSISDRVFVKNFAMLLGELRIHGVVAVIIASIASTVSEMTR